MMKWQILLQKNRQIEVSLQQL